MLPNNFFKISGKRGGPATSRTGVTPRRTAPCAGTTANERANPQEGGMPKALAASFRGVLMAQSAPKRDSTGTITVHGFFGGSPDQVLLRSQAARPRMTTTPEVRERRPGEGSGPRVLTSLCATGLALMAQGEGHHMVGLLNWMSPP